MEIEKEYIVMNSLGEIIKVVTTTNGQYFKCSLNLSTFMPISETSFKEMRSRIYGKFPEYTK